MNDQRELPGTPTFDDHLSEQAEDVVLQRVAELLEDMQVFGLAELADRWGVTKQRADELATGRLGQPWRVLRMGRMWTKDQVEDFEAGWVRKTGIHTPKPTPEKS
jgi:hypothetical protein